MQIELPVSAIAPAVVAAHTLTSGKEIGGAVLKCVLLHAVGDKLLIRASSSTRSIEATIPVKPIEEGQLLVSAAQLAEILRANKDGVVKIAKDEKRCKVSFGRTKSFKINTELPEDFPDLAFFEESHATFVVPRDHLIEMCKRALPVIHKETSKMLLHGLCFHRQDGKLRVLGTNGLALSYTTIDVTPKQEGTTINQAVVFADMPELIGFVASKGTNVEMQFTRRAALVRGDLGQGACLRLMGEYPPYERAVPKTQGKCVTLPRAHLASILDQLDVLSYMGVPTVQLVLEANTATWTAEGQDGRFHQQDEIAFDSDKIVMFYNPLTLSGALKTRKAENLSFEVTGSLAPTVLRELDLPFESLCIFAPLRPGHA